MNAIIQSIIYTTSQPYFWSSMAFTVLIGMFIGAVVYDGVLKEIKKLIIALTSYATIIVIVNLTRVIPNVWNKEERLIAQSYCSTVVIVLVTIFYLFGMYLGVLMVKKAHNGRETI